MNHTRSFVWVLAVLLLVIVTGTPLTAQEDKITHPDDYFGFHPGTDYELFDYEKLIGYLKQLDAESAALKMEEIGTSPLGKPMYLTIVSNPENIANLESLKAINHQLALNPNLTDAERERMAEEGRVFVVATLSMHSGEVGPSQASPLIVYNLITTQDPEVKGWLDDVVFMFVPNHNPDGMDMIVNNYWKYKGTEFEGASLPRVYHKYVGHDNNRDFVILTQDDTRAISRIFTHTWLPQVMVEKHQMGSTGVRYFVPPNHDPIAQNIDAGMWTWVGIFGQNMFNDMTNAGLAGVTQRYIFDNYWPGSTETCLWNNVISFLTEAASAREATPLYIEANELSVGGKGLSEYKKSSNMPLPWEGGWWRLSDIIQYEITSTMSIIKTASLYKEKILLFRNDMCRREVHKGYTEAPYYYLVPQKQHDQGELVHLINLLMDHGLFVYQLEEDMLIEGRQYYQDDFVIPLAQPYRALVKEVMEAQEYPVRHYTPGGDIIRPYDITSWSLPLHRQITSFTINSRHLSLEAAWRPLENPVHYRSSRPDSFTAALFPVTANESYKAAFIAARNGMTVKRLSEDFTYQGQLMGRGSFLIENSKKASGWDEIEENVPISPVYIMLDDMPASKILNIPKIALIETYSHDMDAGWTRYILDHYHIPFTVVRPHELQNMEVVNAYDILVFPDNSKSRLMTGKTGSDGSYYMSSHAPEYVKGMEKKGLQNVLKFLDQGGTILSWGGSTELFEGFQTIEEGDGKEEFTLPFRDQSAELRNQGLYVAGALLKIRLIRDHPLTYGLPDEVGVFSRGRPVFATSVPQFDMDRRVIATYASEDVLMSGFTSKPDVIADKSAVVWIKKGQGQLVVFGFNPHFRASTQASFKLFFNGLLMGRE